MRITLSGHAAMPLPKHLLREVGVGSAAPHSTGRTLIAAAPSVGMEPAEERPSLGTCQVFGGAHAGCSICPNHCAKLDPDYQRAVRSD